VKPKTIALEIIGALDMLDGDQVETDSTYDFIDVATADADGEVMFASVSGQIKANDGVAVRDIDDVFAVTGEAITVADREALIRAIQRRLTRPSALKNGGRPTGLVVAGGKAVVVQCSRYESGLGDAITSIIVGPGKNGLRVVSRKSGKKAFLDRSYMATEATALAVEALKSRA
jgi:hypothetical protein